MAMSVDAHQHFWRYNPAEHTWMTETMAGLKRDFLPADLKPLLESNGFDGCVAVQARQSLEETRWLLELAAENAFVRGVVGWVELRGEDLPEVLAGLKNERKLVGVRHIVQDEPDDEFVLREDFKRGIGRLREFGLTYDVLVVPRQLKAATRLVREFDEQAFVLDHMAKPAIAEGVMEGRMEIWATDVRELARSGNAMCKLSGMVTEAKWKAWREEDFWPYMDVVMEAFGAGRVMIGSDWPVCTLSGEYGETVGVVKRYVERLTETERAAVLGGNCARFYGLD
ncbi:MAG TPA: amidohydrolase family protein [Terracidiphilus sp.]|nr:amidohydrolase family protein [Terracidiphilus sp.]